MLKCTKLAPIQPLAADLQNDFMDFQWQRAKGRCSSNSLSNPRLQARLFSPTHRDPRRLALRKGGERGTCSWLFGETSTADAGHSQHSVTAAVKRTDWRRRLRRTPHRQSSHWPLQRARRRDRAGRRTAERIALSTVARSGELVDRCRRQGV